MAEFDKTKTQELLEDQRLGRDPFQRAREKQAKTEVTPSAFSFDPFENPLNPNEQRPVTLQESLPKPPEKKLENALAPATQAQQRQFEASQVAKSLDTLGLSDIKEGISLTNMGKILLISRLKQRLGEDFEGNPVARRVLDLFNNALAKVDEEDEKADLVRAKSTADRTIEEILRDNRGQTRSRLRIN